MRFRGRASIFAASFYCHSCISPCRRRHAAADAASATPRQPPPPIRQAFLLRHWSHFDYAIFNISPIDAFRYCCYYISASRFSLIHFSFHLLSRVYCISASGFSSEWYFSFREPPSFSHVSHCHSDSCRPLSHFRIRRLVAGFTGWCRGCHFRELSAIRNREAFS